MPTVLPLASYCMAEEPARADFHHPRAVSSRCTWLGVVGRSVLCDAATPSPGEELPGSRCHASSWASIAALSTIDHT